MIVVADTSPINYLILIQEIEILPQLYDRAVTPSTVCEELEQASPRLWSNHGCDAARLAEIRNPSRAADFSGLDIDPGERDAILLAEEIGADRLIIDDQEGRREAERRGLPVSGTLGVLRDAAALGLLDLHEAIRRLNSTNFRISPEVLSKLLGELL